VNIYAYISSLHFHFLYCDVSSFINMQFYILLEIRDDKYVLLLIGLITFVQSSVRL